MTMISQMRSELTIYSATLCRIDGDGVVEVFVGIFLEFDGID